MKMIKACRCVYPVIPRTLRPFILMKLNTTEGRAVFFFLNLSGAFLVQIPPQPVICSSQICALLLLPRHFLQPVASCQHRQPITFLFLVPSDNQASLVFYFLKCYIYATLTQYMRRIACNLMLVFCHPFLVQDLQCFPSAILHYQ